MARRIPPAGEASGNDVGDAVAVTSTPQAPWRAGRFWWDRPEPADVGPGGLRAVIFDLDAVADIECAGHRVAFNAAFAAHGLDIEWSVTRYRGLLALSDERQRVAAELRARGVRAECDVLTELLIDEICRTKATLVGELIPDAGLVARPGLVELLADAFAHGVRVGVVAGGQLTWSAPLVRRLLGAGLVNTVLTAEDVTTPVPDRQTYGLALSALQTPAADALAFAGSSVSLRAAAAAGMAAVLIDADNALSQPISATAVRADFAGAAPLDIADCRQLHRRGRHAGRSAAA